MHSNHPKPICGCSRPRKPAPPCTVTAHSMQTLPLALGTGHTSVSNDRPKPKENPSQSGVWHSKRAGLTSDLRIYSGCEIGRRLYTHSLMLPTLPQSKHSSLMTTAESKPHLDSFPALRVGGPVTGISSSTQNFCLHNCQIQHKQINPPLFPFH